MARTSEKRKQWCGKHNEWKIKTAGGTYLCIQCKINE